jgi:hypothetical protein
VSKFHQSTPVVMSQLHNSSGDIAKKRFPQKGAQCPCEELPAGLRPSELERLEATTCKSKSLARYWMDPSTRCAGTSPRIIIRRIVMASTPKKLAASLADNQWGTGSIAAR